MIVEVFRTNVHDPAQAGDLLAQIHSRFPDYTVNFDLDDCDHILRVESPKNVLEISPLIELFKTAGFEAEVLPDVVPVVEWSDI